MNPKPRADEYDHDALAWLDAVIEWRDEQPRWRTALWAVERWVKRLPKAPGRAWWSAQRVWQRARRGWDYTALWGLDHHLTKTLGAQLTEMAVIAHGWPAGDTYPEFEDWQNALRDNGAKLTAYQTREDLADPASPAYDQIGNDAKDALRWVADNLGTLWD